ncbi:MAG TPA: hypothetical protein VF951_00310 [Streptosporangiaceae bacterium]
MPASVLAVAINSQGGSVLTFALPVGVFVVVSVALYALFTRPHNVPGHREPAVSAAGAASSGPDSSAGQAPADGNINPSDAAGESDKADTGQQAPEAEGTRDGE